MDATDTIPISQPVHCPECRRLKAPPNDVPFATGNRQQQRRQQRRQQHGHAYTSGGGQWQSSIVFNLVTCMGSGCSPTCTRRTASSVRGSQAPHDNMGTGSSFPQTRLLCMLCLTLARYLCLFLFPRSQDRAFGQRDSLARTSPWRPS